MGEYMVMLSSSVDDMSMEYEGASVGDLMSLYAGQEGACIYDDAWALVMYVENGNWREA